MLITSSVSRVTPELLLHAARFTAKYVRLVGQELVPASVSFCVLLGRFGRTMRDGFFLVRVISGQSGLMFVIWAGIWTLLLVVVFDSSC